MEQTTKKSKLGPIVLVLSAHLLSAVLYLSVGLSFFSPLPLLMYAAYRARGWLLFAFLVNAALVTAVLGLSGLSGYVVFVGGTVFGISSGMIYSRHSLEKTALISLGLMLVFATSAAALWSLVSGVGIRELYQAQVNEFADLWLQSIKAQVEHRDLLDEEIKSLVGNVALSVFAVFGILMVWANLVFLVRLNPRAMVQRLGLSPGFLRNFKVPDVLVWPTILAAATLFVVQGVPGLIALNFLIVLLTLYALQGVAILVYFFDAFRLGPLFRILIFFLILTSLWPILVVVGFFDLWFDFRKKFRQSS